MEPGFLKWNPVSKMEPGFRSKTGLVQSWGREEFASMDYDVGSDNFL